MEKLMWPLIVTVLLILGVFSFRGARWAYFAFLGSALLFFPARVGFHLHPQPCECQLNLQLALFSLTNYKHIVLFCIFFLLTGIQARGNPARIQLLIASGAVLAMAIYVELAEGLTGAGHCRLRDLVPDAAGALVGAGLLLAFAKRTGARDNQAPN